MPDVNTEAVMNADNITTGAGAITGQAFVAPADTALTKKDAVTALPSSFESLGYLSGEDGLVNGNTRKSTPVKDWSGNNVKSFLDEKTDTYQYTMIEVMRQSVLKEVFGEDNVTVAGGITTAIANAKELPIKAYVFESMLDGNIPRRMYIPRGQVSEVEEITYKHNETLGYKVKIECYPDAVGNTHYEYTGTAAEPDPDPNPNPNPNED